MSSKCVCGKTCKNLRGLKIHQGRMKCLVEGRQEQRTGQDPDQTQEKQGQEVHHSTQSLHANVAPKSTSTTTNIKWPPSNSIGDWQNFDKDVCEIVRLSSKGNIEARIDLLTVIITYFAAERFGYKEPRQPKVPYKMNRRAEKIKKIRGELKSLKKQHTAAGPEVRPALEELRGLLRAKLKAIRRAEWHRRRGKERARKRTNFIANPFGFARKLLGDKRSGMLESPVEEINAHPSNTFSDPSRDVELININSLISPEPPSVEFNDKPPTWKEIQEVVKAARTSAAPGPNGVPYTVYKRCPGILKLLWKVLRTIWRMGRVADQWRQVEGVCIPKEEKSKEIDQFRIISLLNTEGKYSSAFCRGAFLSS